MLNMSVNWYGDDPASHSDPLNQLSNVNRIFLSLSLMAARARKLFIVMAILMPLAGLAVFRTQVEASFVHTLKRVGSAAEIYGRGPL
jgi:hypothetical protein